MTHPDYNLLVTLDALLAEGNVARAAKRLQLSPSATSRALARLRAVTGDPLLVRSGRGLVPTPRALELREKVGPLVLEVDAVLRPQAAVDLAGVERSFTLRTADGFVETFGPSLLARIEKEAPGVKLRFLQKSDRDNEPLRGGAADLETGVLRETTDPAFRTQSLFRDRFIGVARKGHALGKGKVTAARYANARHVDSTQHAGPPGSFESPVEAALEPLRLRRDIAIVVGGFATALYLARTSDLIATVPARHTGNLRKGMYSFPLPFAIPEVAVAMIWHPRLDADPVHRWLRGCLRDACAGTHDT